MTFDGFNELDFLIALHLLGRVREHGVAAEIVAPQDEITSINGIRLTNVRPLEWSHDAKVVVVGSSKGTLDAVGDQALMARLSGWVPRIPVPRCVGDHARAQLGVCESCTPLCRPGW